MANENLLSRQIGEYITYKRSLGYKIKVEAEELGRFASYAASIGHQGSLTNDLAVSWASQKESYSRFYMARRLEIVHTFAKYISAFDPCAQIPQTGIYGKCHGRAVPYVYTDGEILLLMAEAEKLCSPDGIRARSVSTAIGLLRSTGLRVSELTLLTNRNARLDEGHLFIDSSKFKKGRIVPLHPTVAEELIDYRNFITAKLGQRDVDDFFFVNSRGREFNIRAFEYAFQLIRPVLHGDLANGGARKCRLYDMRHTFACQTVRNWLESGGDVNKKLYLLSVYMGHAKPADTYWYLSATPELLAISSGRYESVFGEGVSI